MSQRSLFTVKEDFCLRRQEWSYQQELNLYKLHDQMGNKWAIISQQLGPGRTDNSVKNHYYSRLRKSLRRINSFIKQHCKKQLRAIPITVLYKIIEAFQQKFKSQPMCDLYISAYSFLKNKILLFSHQEPQHDVYKDHQSIRELIEQILEFNRKYKRKPKKFRRVGNPAFDPTYKDLTKRKKKTEQEQSFIQEKFHYEKQQKQRTYHQLRFQIAEQQYTSRRKQKIITPIILTDNIPNIPEITIHSVMTAQKQNSFHNFSKSQKILEDLGLLEDNLDDIPPPFLSKKRSSVFSHVSSQMQPPSNQDFKFFQESDFLRIAASPLLCSHKNQSIEQKLFT